MRIRRRPTGFWHLEAGGWKLSIKLGRYRTGFRRIGKDGSWMFGGPFFVGNVMRPWRPH